MRIVDSRVYQNDLEKVVSNNQYDFLNKKRILITGGTGLIGSAIVDVIVKNNEVNNANTLVYVAGRDKDLVSARFVDDSNIVYVSYDALEPIKFDVEVDYIIHGASNASPNLYVSNPVETMLANIRGMNNLLKYAQAKGAKKVLFVSSSEVYGAKDNSCSYHEDDYGFIDHLNVRSCYAISKRAAETLCKSYDSEYGVNTAIVRPGHVFGPSAKRSDRRLSSEFAFKAAEGKPLVLKSAGEQSRSYVYSLDCANAILCVLEKGNGSTAYNIANNESTTIFEIATMIAEAGAVSLLRDVPTITEKKTFNPMNNSSLNNEKIKKIGYRQLFSTREGVQHTVSILRETVTAENMPEH